MKQFPIFGKKRREYLADLNVISNGGKLKAEVLNLKQGAPL